ncbi:acyl-CoA dehydrogenase family protein [Myxococcota bacterium]|nr:acyl-CoA dehydrogenase family protein [Myxococcota bacterium]
MNFDLSPDETAFRSEVRRFLDKHLPDDASHEDPDFLESWHAALREKRWIGFAWPEEDGGAAGTLMEQFILKQEMATRNAPPLGSDFMGLTWVGPALIAHGTPEQKARFLPDLLAGTSSWCTGYSEPDHGSDLASLQCRAVLEGDEYRVTGQKIWTTLAHEAKWIYMMVRTDPDARKYRGITCLLVPMNSPGIEVRPIPNLSGVTSFNQVFFDNVRVPVDNRLGEEGQGWLVTMAALANERIGISESTEKSDHLDRLIELARTAQRKGKPASADPTVRRRLARFEARIEAMRLNELRHLSARLEGSAPSSETSLNKLLRGELEFEMSELSLEILGTAGLEEGPWQRAALNWHGTIIGGGSPNIQRNIVAERILGLPKD